MLCQDETMFSTFPMQFQLFCGKISCCVKIPSVPALNTVPRLSWWHLTHIHSYCTAGKQGPEGQLHITGGLWRAELWDCYPFYGRAKNNSETSLREGRAPDCPAGAVINQGQYFRLGIAHTLLGWFFSTSPPSAVADSGCGKCVHTAQSAASTPAQAQPEKQCQATSCQAGRSAELLPCHHWTAQGSWPSKGHGLGFSSPKQEKT